MRRTQTPHMLCLYEVCKMCFASCSFCCPRHRLCHAMCVSLAMYFESGIMQAEGLCQYLHRVHVAVQVSQRHNPFQ